MFNDFSSLDFLSGIMHIQYFILNLGRAVSTILCFRPLCDIIYVLVLRPGLRKKLHQTHFILTFQKALKFKISEFD